LKPANPLQRSAKTTLFVFVLNLHMGKYFNRKFDPHLAHPLPLPFAMEHLA
jgi:hypothetical protein